MKKILFALLVTAGFGLSQAQKIEFETATLDYGQVALNADGHRTFTVKNTGTKDLVLSSVQPSCGCTATEFTKTPIAPGKTGTITVLYNTGIPGAFSKSIEVFSNDPEKQRSTIFIKGVVQNAATAAKK